MIDELKFSGRSELDAFLDSLESGPQHDMLESLVRRDYAQLSEIESSRADSAALLEDAVRRFYLWRAGEYGDYASISAAPSADSLDMDFRRLEYRLVFALPPGVALRIRDEVAKHVEQSRAAEPATRSAVADWHFIPRFEPTASAVLDGRRTGAEIARESITLNALPLGALPDSLREAVLVLRIGPHVGSSGKPSYVCGIQLANAPGAADSHDRLIVDIEGADWILDVPVQELAGGAVHSIPVTRDRAAEWQVKIEVRDVQA